MFWDMCNYNYKSCDISQTKLIFKYLCIVVVKHIWNEIQSLNYSRSVTFTLYLLSEHNRIPLLYLQIFFYEITQRSCLFLWGFFYLRKLLYNILINIDKKIIMKLMKQNESFMSKSKIQITMYEQKQVSQTENLRSCVLYHMKSVLTLFTNCIVFKSVTFKTRYEISTSRHNSLRIFSLFLILN